MAEKKLNILFVCERGHPPLDYLRAFAADGHRFKICTDADRAIDEFNRKPFGFDCVVINTNEEGREDQMARFPEATAALLRDARSRGVHVPMFVLGPDFLRSFPDGVTISGPSPDQVVRHIVYEVANKHSRGL